MHMSNTPKHASISSCRKSLKYFMVQTVFPLLGTLAHTVVCHTLWDWCTHLTLELDALCHQRRSGHKIVHHSGAHVPHNHHEYVYFCNEQVHHVDQTLHSYRVLFVLLLLPLPLETLTGPVFSLTDPVCLLTVAFFLTGPVFPFTGPFFASRHAVS